MDWAEVDINAQLKWIIGDHTGEIFRWELVGISVVPALETPIDWPLGCVFERACGGSN